MKSLPFFQSGLRRFRGFTLVELLVTMVLLSMVMVGLMSVMRSTAQAQDRIESRLRELDDFRVARGFLETALGRLSARRVPRLLQVGESPYQFSGRAQELMWVGVMPARFGMGGRSFFRLAVENGRSGPSLILRYAPWNGASGLPDWAAAEWFEVAPSVKSFALTYEDAWLSAPSWVAEWRRIDSLPARVRIELETESGPWPLWIVPLRWLPANQPGSGRFTSGG
jgi:general secretion pathway protein J